METKIMQQDSRLVVFNDQARHRLATANEAIRRIRVRGGLLRVSEVRLDSDHPLILLEGLPPEMLLDAGSGLHSRRIIDDPEGRFVVRCTAYGCDWSWLSAVPAVHVSRQAVQAEPVEVRSAPNVVHPMFGGQLLRTAGEAR